MHQCGAGPSPHEQAPETEKGEEGEVEDDNGIGHHAVRHRSTTLRHTLAVPRRTTAILAAASFGYGWWATALPPFAGTTGLAIVAAGAAAMWFGARYRRPRPARPQAVDMAALAVVLGSLGVWQAAAYLQHPRRGHPTLSSLTNAALDSHPARAAAFAAWVVAAALLARR